MKVHIHRSDQFVYGAVPLTDHLSDSDSPFGEPTGRSDPMRTILHYSLGFLRGYDPAHLCGVKGGRSAEVSTLVEPMPVRVSYNLRKDNFDYGRGLWSFIRGDAYHKGRSVLKSRENLVEHCRLRGEVLIVPEGAVSWPPTASVAMFGVVIPSFQLDAFQRLNLIDTFHFLNGGATAHWSPRSGVLFYTKDALRVVREKLRDGEYGVGDAYWIDNQHAGISVKEMSFTESSDLCEVSYVLRYRYYDLFMHLTNEIFRRVTVSMRLDRVVEDGSRSGLDDYWSSAFGCKVTTTSEYFDANSFLGYSIPAKWSALISRGPLVESVAWSSAIFGCGYILNDAATTQEKLNNVVNTINRRGDAFRDAVNLRHDALTAGAFYSTGEALHGWIDIIETNVLEFLVEAREVAKLLPDVRGLIALYNDVRKLRLVRAGTRLLDVVSDAELYYNFGLRPNTQLTTEFVNKHDELFRRSPASLSGKKTLYGRYRYVHHFDDGTSWSIDFTSKVRLVIPDSLLLFGIFGLNALGLLPSPGNIWDALKSSWIVDLLFGIGNKLKAVDTQGMLLLIDAGVGTHSHKVIEDDILGDLGQLGLQTIGSRAPYGQYYYRGVSVLLPSLRGCEFDYNPPSKASWEVALSFLYKTMKF